MAKNENRNYVGLKCSVCKNVNYFTSKNKKNTPDKLNLNKFCKFCRKVTEHKEVK